ncbi:hypothetical protein MMC29_002143 [Sticta canariensis]|nr:hypothetical protein [Sticta canariensis]
MPSESIVNADSLEQNPPHHHLVDESAQSRSDPGKGEVILNKSNDDTDVADRSESEESSLQNPPLPQEAVPPALVDQALSYPQDPQDDGWDPVWDESAQTYYFYNRFTGASQWTNPRVPESKQLSAPGVGNYDRMPNNAPGPATENSSVSPVRPHGGYDPAIHGDYDPTAAYAQEAQAPLAEDGVGAAAGADPSSSSDPGAIYTATGVFNRFTGKWQPNSINPEMHNDENKSKRQMSAFFDVDAAANSHNGKSLKAERSGKKLTKQELRAFKEKRKEKKEEKRRAWLRD